MPTIPVGQADRLVAGEHLGEAAIEVSVPMVTMIEGSCRPMTSKALKSPSSEAREPRQTSDASGIGTPACSTQAKRQADSAMVEAGERSISPAMMTMVSTSAISDSSAVQVEASRM